MRNVVQIQMGQTITDFVFKINKLREKKLYALCVYFKWGESESSFINERKEKKIPKRAKKEM